MKYIIIVFSIFTLILSGCSEKDDQKLLQKTEQVPQSTVKKTTENTVQANDTTNKKTTEVSNNLDTELAEKANNTLADFISSDPGINNFFEKAYGYAVFPTIGKAGFGVGGAHGKGIVYKQGVASGTTSMTQVTLGLQIGAQGFSEVIFFEDQKTYEDFIKGNYEAGAQVSAVVVKKGAAAQTKYSKGIAIFTHVKGGLMAEASVGGQKFSFEQK